MLHCKNIQITTTIITFTGSEKCYMEDIRKIYKEDDYQYIEKVMVSNW